MSFSMNLQSKIYRISEYTEFRNICIALSHIDDRYLEISINHLLIFTGRQGLGFSSSILLRGRKLSVKSPGALFTTVWPGKILLRPWVSTCKKNEKVCWESMPLTGLLWRVNETTDVWVVTQSTPFWCFSMHLFPF